MLAGVKEDFDDTLLHLECLGFADTAGENRFWEQKHG